MSQRDPYEVLGVQKTASASDIKKAYRQQALKFHPDTNKDDPGAEAKFKEVAQAYEILSDDERRKMFDQFGHSGPPQQGGGFDPFSSGIFDDLLGGLGGFFGGRQQQRQRDTGPRPGNDIQLAVEIDLLEAHTGTSSGIEIPRQAVCETCNGSRCNPGTGLTPCNMCGGCGQVHQQVGGFMRVSTTCSSCAGQGQRLESPCQTCCGQGVETRTSTVKVKIPAGVADGNVLKLTGLGDASTSGGPAGDALLIIRVRSHPRFQRQGNDLRINIDVGYPVMCLGGQVDVKLIDDSVIKVTIPAGSQVGDLLRIKNHGMTITGTSDRGSLLINIFTSIPRNLSPQAVAALQILADELASRGT